MDNNVEIEEAIKAFIGNKTEEQLATTLSIMRHNLDKEVIVSVDQQENGLVLKPVRTSDGKLWFMVFTSFEEQLKNSKAVQSMFSASLKKVFMFTLENIDVEGVIINPYGSSMSLNRKIIQVVLGKIR